MQKGYTTLVTRQNMFHVTVHLLDRWCQNVFRTKIDAWGEAECVTDVLNTSCHFLWSITGQTHGKMESICFTLKRRKNCVWWHRPCVCLPIDHKKEPIWKRIGLRTVISHDQLQCVVQYSMQTWNAVFRWNRVKPLLKANEAQNLHADSELKVPSVV